MGQALDVLGSISTRVESLLASGLVHGTILAALTLLLCSTVLRRGRPALVAALWTIVLVKFAIPVGPQVPLSVDGIAGSILGADSGAAATVQTAVGEAVGPARGAPGTKAATGGSSIAETAAHLALLALYFACVFMLLWRRLRRQRTAVAAARALPAAPVRVREQARRTARALALRRAPELRMDPGHETPYVVGVFRPVVVIPAFLSARVDALESVLAHELAHLRRFDVWVRCAQVAISAFFFFWPVVAWVNRRLDCAREMACDQWAVLHGRLGAVAYARLLFDLARRTSQDECNRAPAMALISRRRQLERRIDGLVTNRARAGLAQPRMGLAAGVGLCLWALVSLGGAARADTTTRGDLYPECVIDPQLVQHILSDYPEADTDGDGVLTREEICAHQALMKRRVLDDAFESMGPDFAREVASWLDPAVDRDGDGVLSQGELDQLTSEVATTLRPEDLGLDPIEFPGQICEEAPVSCTESQEPAAP